MFKGSRIYAMLDDKEKKSKPILLKNIEEAKDYNQRFYGIFFSVNAFIGRRKTKCLDHINAWSVDIDGIPKEEQMVLVQKSPLPPSVIVESKSSFHLYWVAEDATAQAYKDIVLHRLIPFFKGDKNASVITQLLRMPEYCHWKDRNNPFLVKIVYQSDSSYSERRMLDAFRSVEIKSRRDVPPRFQDYDNVSALDKLSGAGELKKEKFSFQKNSNGTRQICVNGKSTSCWIDQKGLIGSRVGGGPTWIQWVMWYGHSFQQAKEIGRNYGIK